MSDPIRWRLAEPLEDGREVIIVRYDGLCYVVCFDTPGAEGRTAFTEPLFEDAVAYCYDIFGIPPDSWR